MNIVYYTDVFYLSSVVRNRKSSSDCQWEQIKYLVSDFIPAVDSDKLTFSERQEILSKLIQVEFSDEQIVVKPHAIFRVRQTLVHDLPFLMKFYQQVISHWGEGIVLVQPNSLYLRGVRSNYKLKDL